MMGPAFDNPPPALVAAADQLKQQALEDAMKIVWLYLVGATAGEAGDQATADQYQMARVQWLLSLGAVRTQAMTLELTKLFASTLFDQWGGSWAKVMEAVADPTLPLFPGGPVIQDHMPPIN
jgi:hypothetical protein